MKEYFSSIVRKRQVLYYPVYCVWVTRTVSWILASSVDKAGSAAWRLDA